jgi:hypothetical protein
MGLMKLFKGEGEKSLHIEEGSRELKRRGRLQGHVAAKQLIISGDHCEGCRVISHFFEVRLSNLEARAELRQAGSVSSLTPGNNTHTPYELGGNHKRKLEEATK